LVRKFRLLARRQRHVDIPRAHVNHQAMRRCLFIALIYGSALLVVADAQEGPKNAVILIIRHAEDPPSGHGLSPRGEERAKAYINYFQNFTVDSKRREPEAVLVAADSKQSHRPRLTVEPFAKAAKLPIDRRFANKQPTDLASELRANYQGKVILVCWHHGQIPALLRALGAVPETLLPNGKWPKTVYDWVLMVSFDENGRVIPESTRRISEHLLQGDSQ
jgi:broad specificity phosphatase PhoE